jgi:rhamnogalacturonyl hydrolase YesR
MPMSVAIPSGQDVKGIDDTNGELVRGSIERLEEWINGDYEGWDPYDGANSERISNLRWGRQYIQMGMIQLHRLSPINLRDFLGVSKGIDTKGLAVFAQAYLILYSATGRERYLQEATTLSQALVNNSLVKKVGHHAWASHYFPFVGADRGSLAPDSPDLIGTCNVLKALSMLHLITKDEQLERVICSCQSFLKSMVDQKGDIFYFLYAPQWKGKIVPNASAEAIGSVTLSLRARWDEELHASCDRVLRSILELQREDGSWAYSIYSNGREYNQYDFHQGYMIGGLLSYQDLAPSEMRQEVQEAIARAVTFYRGLFKEDGRSVYRAPRSYPVEIHNQAQGIITFSELGARHMDTTFLAMADKIADWTITNMQDGRGFFYYQKWPVITNKIPYMRWGQAWMMLALGNLLSAHSSIKPQ